MKNIYLSIDLDYWDCIAWETTEDKFFNAKEKLINKEKLFDKLVFLNIPIKVVWEHHHLVKYINKSKCEHIINIDFHSDLCSNDGNKTTLNEGTVFNFVTNKKEKTYTWIMPYKEVGMINGMGRCDDCYYMNVFSPKNWVFKKQVKTVSKKIDFNSIKEVGIVISPNWITLESYPFIKEKLFSYMNQKLIDKCNKNIYNFKEC